MQKTREDRASAWNETRLGKALCPWIALVCLLGWLFCVLVLLPIFVGVLSIADLCSGKKPRLLAPDPDDVESIPVGSESTASENWLPSSTTPGVRSSTVPEQRPRERDCGSSGSAEPVYSQRRLYQHRT